MTENRLYTADQRAGSSTLRSELHLNNQYLKKSMLNRIVCDCRFPIWYRACPYKLPENEMEEI